MNEFKLYDKIINGEYRPHLQKNSTDEGLEKLERAFFAFPFLIKDQKNNWSIDLTSLNFDFHGMKNGDAAVLKISDENDGGEKKITLEILSNSEEKELYNMDIVPPLDAKSELYLNIIEGEFNRIKSSSKKKLESSGSLEEIKLYAIKNIQFAKELAKQAHTLNKKLSKHGVDDWNNTDTLILYYLKLHLIYSIRYLQELFASILEQKQQSEGELEDELFEMQRTIREAQSKDLSEWLEARYIKKLYNEIAEPNDIESAISFFKDKLRKSIDEAVKIQRSKGYILKLRGDKIGSLRAELGKLLTKKILEIDKNDNLISRYKYLVSILQDLNMKPESLESSALREVDSISKLQTEVRLLKDLIEVDSPAIERTALIDDLIPLLLIVQGRKHVFKEEDEINDHLSDLLRARRYYVADQSRQGRSGSNNTDNYKSGELDISIRDAENYGIVETIIEAFQLSSCGNKNTSVKYHIDKLMNRYDTSGNEENFIIVYAKARDFMTLWESYKRHVVQRVFKGTVIFEEVENPRIKKGYLKVGLTKIKQGDLTRKLYHLFVNMFVEN